MLVCTMRHMLGIFIRGPRRRGWAGLGLEGVLHTMAKHLVQCRCFLGFDDLCGSAAMPSLLHFSLAKYLDLVGSTIMLSSIQTAVAQFKYVSEHVVVLAVLISSQQSQQKAELGTAGQAMCRFSFVSQGTRLRMLGSVPRGCVVLGAVPPFCKPPLVVTLEYV